MPNTLPKHASPARLIATLTLALSAAAMPVASAETSPVHGAHDDETLVHWYAESHWQFAQVDPETPVEINTDAPLILSAAQATLDETTVATPKRFELPNTFALAREDRANTGVHTKTEKHLKADDPFYESIFLRQAGYAYD